MDNMNNLENIYVLYKESYYPVVEVKPKARDIFILHPSIKSRVERDCLPVSQNKTENLNNTYSKKPVYQVPKSADYSYVMRVLKETGIDRGGRPENKGRPIKVMIKLSKMTLFHKLNNYHNCSTPTKIVI